MVLKKIRHTEEEGRQIKLWVWTFFLFSHAFLLPVANGGVSFNSFQFWTHHPFFRTERKGKNSNKLVDAFGLLIENAVGKELSRCCFICLSYTVYLGYFINILYIDCSRGWHVLNFFFKKKYGFPHLPSPDVKYFK